MENGNKISELMVRYPAYEQLATETERIREIVDGMERGDGIGTVNEAFEMMLTIDTNMLTLLSYHLELSTACLRRVKELEEAGV